MKRIALGLTGMAFAFGFAAGGCGDDASGNDTGGTTGTTTGADTTQSASGSPTSNTTSADTTMSTGSTTDPSTGDATDSATEGSSSTGSAVCPYTPVDGRPGVELELVGSGFNRPVLALGHPTEPDRLFVVEQSGTVKILEPGMNVAPADNFLSVDSIGSGATEVGDERGLLGFDFHPDFPRDPRVYVAYNPAEGGGSSPPTIVEEYTVTDGGAGVADPASARLVIGADQPNTNHNGGMIAFGPDGYLYFGLGDGGGGGDTYNTGNDTGVILAKILRIGVEPDGTADNPVACQGGNCGQLANLDYTIPADNPFVGNGAYAPEIYATGMRNPWRFSFDPQDGTLYVADVGQDAYEEVSVVEAGGNYGWSTMEGNHCFGGGCDDSAGPNQVNSDGLTMPIAEYDQGGGRCSITGLGVYRSCEVPAWDGIYFYSDYCSEEVYALHWDGQNVTELGEVWQSEGDDHPLGGGHNAYGDVFVTTAVFQTFGLPFTDGRVYRIVPAG